MKKVLALVLAVIMVCTMAMAVTVITPADVTVVASELPQVVESDADATYGIEIPSDYYNADLANKVVEASNVTLAKKEGKLYVVVPTLDKALDGVADFTFTGTLKVTDKNDSTTFYVYSIKDGKLQQTSGQVKGIPVSATALKTWNDAVASRMVVEKYDIGFATEVVDTDTKFEAAFNALSEADDYAAQWYVTGKKAVTFTDNNVTVTVPANTSFKMYRPTDAVIPAAAGAYAEGFRGLFVEGNGVTMTLKEKGDTGDHFYAIDKNGKVYDLGAKMAVKTNTDGSYYGEWTAKFGGTYRIVNTANVLETVGTVPGVTTGNTTTGTTTNPGTGANDVVGVAAALAVVALVSGAAISLKK